MFNLNNINRIITHGKCPDGIASAIILYDKFKIEPEFYIHGTREYLEIKATAGMLFCDITPPKDRYQEFINAGAIVLDHHISTKYIVDAFGDNGVFADEQREPGVSGAVLAFKTIYPDKYNLNNVGCKTHALYILAWLAGIKDTWQKDHPEWHDAGAQACMLKFYSWDYFKKKIDYNDWNYNNEYNVGRMIYNDRLEKVKLFADQAFTFENSGYKVAIFNDPDYYTSGVSNILYNRGINVIAGFRYTRDPTDKNPIICFSIRSDGSINVADLAETVSGGGHSKAAGFSEIISLKEINPFAMFMDIFEDYINYYKVR